LRVVAKTGEHTITLSSSDYVVYTSKLTVPEPQVSLTTSIGGNQNVPMTEVLIYSVTQNQ
jgi:hypothetical protein